MADIQSIELADLAYPALLKEIHDPPKKLYYLGDVSLLQGFCLAVVGTRRPTLYAQSVSKKIVAELALTGAVIVSGLAMGIDSVAHEAALAVGGKTIAVLGAGMNFGVLRTNRELFERICGQGLVISEFAPEVSPQRWTFVQRNRIISGLSHGTLMVEGDYTSGAMITAKFANDQNREVFAIPGRIDCPNSRGAHWLIKNGAKLVETAGDILDECNQIAILPNLTKEERWFYDCISHEPITIDELYLKVGNSVFSLLTALEMKGLIKQICGKVVRAG